MPYNHWDTHIDYIAAKEDLAFHGFWQGNSFQHIPFDGSPVRYADHLDYKTWDGSPWSAIWVAELNEFKHTNMDFGEERVSMNLDYLAPDRSKWSAIRATRLGMDGFYHIYVAPADGDSSDFFGQLLSVVGNVITYANVVENLAPDIVPFIPVAVAAAG